MGGALMARVKESMGIVGLDVVPNAWEVLISLNMKTLDEIKAARPSTTSLTTGLRFARRMTGSRSRSRCDQIEEDWEKMIDRLTIIRDRKVRCWEIGGSSSQSKAAISHNQPVLCSTWKDDGTTMFIGGCDKIVKMWPLLPGGQPTQVAVHDASIKEIAWIEQLNCIITGSWDKTFRGYHDAWRRQ